jgi:hypothetical protein
MKKSMVGVRVASSLAILVVGILHAPVAHATACDDYMACVCEFAERVASATGSAPDGPECEELAAMYDNAHPMMQDACRQMLDAYKRSMEAMAPVYQQLGVQIPASCR